MEKRLLPKLIGKKVMLCGVAEILLDLHYLGVCSGGEQVLNI